MGLLNIFRRKDKLENFNLEDEKQFVEPEPDAKVLKVYEKDGKPEVFLINFIDRGRLDLLTEVDLFGKNFTNAKFVEAPDEDLPFGGTSLKLEVDSSVPREDIENTDIILRPLVSDSPFTRDSRPDAYEFSVSQGEDWQIIDLFDLYKVLDRGMHFKNVSFHPSFSNFGEYLSSGAAVRGQDFGLILIQDE